MNDNTAQLANAFGLDDHWYDFKGRYRDVPIATRRAILDAMGVDADSPENVDRLLAVAGDNDWRRVLPPVAVVRADDGATVDITLPASLPQPVTLGWSIAGSNGGSREFTVTTGELECLDRRVVDGVERLRYRAGLPGDLPVGEYRLTVVVRGSARHVADTHEMPLFAVPAACYEPPPLASGEKLWGLAVQLYTLRSAGNWGIGDFGDLKRLARTAASHGVDVIGLNPLHALFPANPRAISPYSPSSRTYLNVWYIDVSAMPGYEDCEPLQRLVSSPSFRRLLDRAREVDMVDYRAVAALKMAAFRLLYQHFRSTAAAPLDVEDFRRFVRRQGAALEIHATFDALHAHFMSQTGEAWGFARWPEAYRRPDSDAVTRFALEHRDAIDFYLYLQWVADRQLRDAQAAAVDAGMRIGLYRDLAVGVDAGGAEAWASQDLYCLGASVGAPPDALAIQGQDWGLPPLDPRRLRETAYSEFIHMIRGNMRHCGALRIDHVMALMRLWWLPRGGSATDGVYVNYPLDDLLGLLALESMRRRCLVIGEDLGTVPDAIRHALPAASVYSYRVLPFEKAADGEMVAPRDYPARAMATVSTHDLPTLYTFWSGDDLLMRRRLGLFPTDEIRVEMETGRAHDRRAMLAALDREGLLPDNGDADADGEMTPALSEALHAYLARSRAGLMVVQPEDIVGERRATNLPGTTDEHPNWQRKLAIDIERLFDDPHTVRFCRRVTEERRRAGDGGAP